MYLLVITFAVAILTLDERRIQQNRNSFVPCIVHTSDESIKLWCNPKLMHRSLQFVYKKIILTTLGKVKPNPYHIENYSILYNYHIIPFADSRYYNSNSPVCVQYAGSIASRTEIRSQLVYSTTNLPEQVFATASRVLSRYWPRGHNVFGCN